MTAQELAVTYFKSKVGQERKDSDLIDAYIAGFFAALVSREVQSVANAVISIAATTKSKVAKNTTKDALAIWNGDIK